MFGRSVLLVTVIIFTEFSALADSPAPQYTNNKESPDGRFLFVMISSYLVDIDGKGYREPFVTEIPQIRKTYPKSGLYKNDGSTLPVWTVEWFAQEVEPLSDEIHIVRCGPWASSPFTQAVTFFTIKSVGHTQALSIIQKA